MTSAAAQSHQLLHFSLRDIYHNREALVALGVITHQIISSFESDNSFHLILPAWAIFWTGAAIAEIMSGPSQSALEALTTIALSAATYFGALFSSILLYRAFFHRLRKARTLVGCYKVKADTVPAVPRSIFCTADEAMGSRQRSERPAVRRN
jgi:hypothetical protein